MRVANLDGRAVLIDGARAHDIAALTGGVIGPSMSAVYEQWGALADLAPASPDDAGVAVDESGLGCPVPEPRQVFAIGLNYRAHAAESKLDVPSVPATFTKYRSALSGPFADIAIVNDTIDWEVELVVVIGQQADRVPASAGWQYVAGLTVGQDISDRTLQFAAGRQFCLGKSQRGFGPMGPVVVSVDEFADPDDLELGCSVNGEIVQQARTTDMVFSVPRLIAELSAVVTLYPGDVIFTGTPAGVGQARTPPRFLRPGDLLETWIEGIGRMRNTCVGRADG